MCCVVTTGYQNRFAVREYEYDPQALDAEKKDKEKLERDLKRQFVSFIEVQYMPTIYY